MIGHIIFHFSNKFYKLAITKTNDIKLIVKVQNDLFKKTTTINEQHRIIHKNQ